MFEGLVTSLLNRFLGPWIEGLDGDQLSLGVWRGEIHLTNLKVKPSALDFLHLPVGVRLGTVGLFRLKVNWRHIFSQPVEVFLEEVAVVAGNKDMSRIDDDAEVERALQAKLAQLKSIEDFKLSEAYQDAVHGRPAKKVGKAGYVGQLLATVIDNIQITVRHVHVRFEHDGARNVTGGPSGERSALGLVLNSFTVRSTDVHGVERFVAAGSSDTNTAYKRADLNGLSIYFNTHRSSSGATKPASEQDMASFFDGGESRVDYMLRPLHGTVRLELNKNEPADGSPPATKVSMKLQALEIALDEVQYRALLLALASISRAAAADQLIHQRYVDLFRSGHPHERHTYMTLYRRTLAPSWEQHLDAIERAELTRLEKELSLETLASWRAMVFHTLLAQIPGRTLTKRPPANEGGFVSRWVGSAVSAAKSVVGRGEGLLPAPDVELNDEQFEALCHEAIEAGDVTAMSKLPIVEHEEDDTSSSSVAATVPNSHVGMALDFEQSTVSFSLLTNARRPLATFSIIQTRVAFEQRVQGMRARITLGNVSVADQVTPNTLYPAVFGMSRAQREKLSLLASATSSSPRETPSSPASAAAPFIDLTYDAQPLDDSADAVILLSILPSLLVVHNKFISRVLAFFAPDKNAPSQQQDVLQAWGAANLQYIKAATTVSLNDAFKTHASLALQVHIAAPTILVTCAPNILQASALVVDLGVISVESTPQSQETLHHLRETIAIKQAVMEAQQKSGTATPSSASTALVARNQKMLHVPHAMHTPLLTQHEIGQCYDEMNIRVTDVQLFLSQTQRADGSRGFDAKAKEGVLAQLNIGTKVSMSIAPDIGWMPTMKVAGELATIQVDLSTSNFHKIMAIANSFTAPPTSPAPRDPELELSPSPAPSPYANPAAMPPPPPLQIDGEAPPPVVPSSTSHALLLTKEFLTLSDLTELFQSERDARHLLADLDEDGNGEVSRDEYEAWYHAKKQVLKHKMGMQVEFRIGAVNLRIVDDRRPVLPLATGSASSSSSTAAAGTSTSAVHYHPPRAVISLRLTDLLFTQSTKSFDSTIQLELGELTVTDCLTSFSGDFKSLISTRTPANSSTRTTAGATLQQGQAGKFMTVTMNTVSPVHPEFVEQSMVGTQVGLTVGTFILLVDPHSINDIAIFFLKSFLPKADLAEMNHAAAAPSAPAPTPVVESSPASASSSTDVSTVTMKVDVTVGLVQLLLTQRGRFLTKFAAQAIAAQVALTDVGSMVVESSINKMALVDLRGLRPLPVVIGIEPVDPRIVRPCLQIKYTKFAPAGAIAFGYATHVDVQLRSIKLIQDFYFVGAVLQYLTMTLALPFLAGDRQQHIAANVVQKIEEKVEDKVAEIVAQSPSVPFLKFTVLLDDVELVFPNHKTQQAAHKLTLHIRDLTVANYALYGDGPTGRVEYQQFAVGIGGFSLLSSFFPGPEANSRATTIMHMQQLAIVANMSQAINATLDVRVESQRMDVTLAQENFPFLMEMVFAILDNLGGLTAPGPAETNATTPAPPAAPAAPAPAVAPADHAAPNWIKASVRFHDMSIQLLKQKGWNVTDGLMTVLGRGVDIRFQMDTNGGGAMAVQTAWDAFELVDDSHREGAPPVLAEYRRMMGMREPTTPPIVIPYASAYAASLSLLGPCDLSRLALAHLSSDPPLVGSMYVLWAKHADGSMDIELQQKHLYYCVCSMVVMEMTTFFVMPPPPPGAPIAATPAQKAVPHEQKLLYGAGNADEQLHLMGDALVTGALVPRLPGPAPSLVLNVALRMPGAAIQLLSSNSVARARNLTIGLDLSVSFYMADSRMKTSVQLDSLRAIESTATVGSKGALLLSQAAHAKQEFILQPTNLHVAFLNEPSQIFLGHSNMTVDVGIDDTIVNLGYQQYQVLMGALAVMYPPKPAKEAEAAAVVDRPVAGGQPAQPSAAAPPPPAAPPAALPSALHFSEQNIHVQVRSVQLNVINDFYHNSMFLLRFQLTNVLMKLHRFGDSGGLLAKLDLSGDFFNHRVGCWEPLLEQWDLVFSHHASCNTRTPQEYLLLNQPTRKYQQQLQATHEPSDAEPSASADQSESESDSASRSESASHSYSNTDKSMTADEICTALTPFTELSISSTKPFNLNLSVASIQDLIDCLALLQTATLKPVPDVKFYKYPPYRVENHTNLEMEIFLTTDAGRTPALAHQASSAILNPIKALNKMSQKAMSVVGLADEVKEEKAPTEVVLSPTTKENLRTLASKSILIPAYSEANIAFPDYIEATQRAIHVRFQPAQLGLTPFTLPVGVTKTIRTLLTPKTPAGDETVCVTDISIKKGMRIISIHSSVAIANNTDGEIAVRTTLRTEHIVPRGKLFWLPLLPTNRRREVNMRPYEARDEEVDTTMVGQERIIQSPDEGTAVNAPVALDAGPGVGLVDAKGLPLQLRVLPPTQCAEHQVLHHWSGEIVCDPKEHLNKRNSKTHAMHYRCARQAHKAGLQRASALHHQTAKLFHANSESQATMAEHRASLAGQEARNAIHQHIVYDSFGAPRTGESDAYNFTVYASFWRKKEIKSQVAEDAAAAQHKQTSGAPDVASPEPPPLTEEVVTFGELGKKKHCSIYYIRNPLTIENFLATKVQVRLYNNNREVDEEVDVVESNFSPSAKAAAEGAPSPSMPSVSAAAGKEKAPGTFMHRLSSATHLAGSTPASPPKLIEEVTLDRGQAFPSHAISTHVETFMSVRLPHLACGWSDLTPVKLSKEPRTVKFHLSDSGNASGQEPGSLTILAELSVQQGHVHCVLFTHYWIFDLTKLGLLMINDETKQPLPRLATGPESGNAMVKFGAGGRSLTQSKLLTEGDATHSGSTEEEKRAVDERGERSQPNLLQRTTSLNSTASANPLVGTPTGEEKRDPSSEPVDPSAQSAEELARTLDTYEPVMFSSRHHDAKKQRIRLKAGYEVHADGPNLHPHGALGAIVPHNLIGPVNEPSDYSTISVTTDNMVTWTDWSSPVSMEHVGTTESVRMSARATSVESHVPVTSTGRQLELICKVSAGRGRFFRTKQVTFAPRYILVNKLAVPIRLKQYAGVAKSGEVFDSGASQLVLAAGASEIFHWPHALKHEKSWLAVQRVGDQFVGWNWSGYFDIATAADYPMVVTHSTSHQSWFLQCDIRMGPAGTAFIVIDEFKNQELLEALAVELPYLIQNRSDTQTIRFRQVRDKPELSSRYAAPCGPSARSPTSSASSSLAVSAAGEVSPYDWFEVPPHGVMPYIWEEPLQEHAIIVEFSVLSTTTKRIVDWQKTIKLKLDDADEEGDRTLRFRSDETNGGHSSGAAAAEKVQKMFYFHESSGPTQILAFSDRARRGMKKSLLTLVSGVTGLAADDDAKELKEIPDGSGPPAAPGRLGRMFGSSRKSKGGGPPATVVEEAIPPTSEGGCDLTDEEKREVDGGLAAFDPANQPEEDRRLLNELDADAPKAHGSTAAAGAPPSLAPISIPIDFTSPGVLHLTVIGASGFKSSRQKMFAGVVFNDIIQRTGVQKGTREPKWHQRMTFRTEIDSDDTFAPKSCFCCSSDMGGRDPKTKVNAQTLYVNLYEQTTFSDHFLGCATINLREVGLAHVDRWFDVTKHKGGRRGYEKRGRVHLGLWWQQEGAEAMAQNQIQEDEPVASPNTLALPASESASTSVAVPSKAARLHRLASTPESVSHLRELVRLTEAAAYQECDRSTDTVWSEFRVRILTTSLMKELAVSHQLDFLQGRLVAYVTSPLIPRGFSVLLMDHGVHNMVKRWRQDIHFAVPHYQATRYRKDAIVRITLFFFKSKNYKYEPIEQMFSPNPAHRSPAPPSVAGHSLPHALPAEKPDRPMPVITGFAEDLFTEPMRIGECIFDLMSVRELEIKSTGAEEGDDADEKNEEKMQMDAEQAQSAADSKAAQLAEEEEEQAAHASARFAAKEKATKKTKKQLREEERDRQKREWEAKWLPIVSSIKTPVHMNAPIQPGDDLQVIRQPSLCLNVKRHIRERHKTWKPTTTSVKVAFPLFGLSVIDSTPEEVAYLSMAGVGCTLHDSPWQTTVAATIHSVQLDNLLRQASFPVVFNPTIIQGETTPQPFVQLALNKKKSTIPNMSLFPYFSVLVQKMDIRVEEVNIWRTLAFVNQMAVRFSGDITADLDPALLTRRFSAIARVPESGTQKLYFKLLHVQPLAVNISFASNPGQRHAANYHINPFYTALQSLQAGIGNINDAPLRLNGKLIENALGTSDTIVWSLVSHYIQQGVMEAYKIFGSIEFLGNPVGLAHELGTGTMEFFTEPAKGLMISPEAFGSGLAKGSSGLVKSTIGGLMGAASAVTNSASKAMATASGDEAFMANQAAGRNQKQPEHIGEGIKMGVTALGTSLFSGVTGVFLDPLKGAKKDGMLGFGRGVATGLAGLVFKPIAGVLDLTTNTLKGIGGTAGWLLDGPVRELRPFRPRRWIDPTRGILTPFDLTSSIAHDPLWHAEQNANKKALAHQEKQRAKEKDAAHGHTHSPQPPTIMASHSSSSSSHDVRG